MSSSSESIPRAASISDIETGISTISASIPFNYGLSTKNSNPMDDTDSLSSDSSSVVCNSTSSQSLEEAVMNCFGSPDTKTDHQQFSSLDSIPLQNLNTVRGDEKLQDKEICSDSDYDNTKCASQDNSNSVRLEVIPCDDTPASRPRSCAVGAISLHGKQKEDASNPPPQVQIRLYRNKDNNSMRISDRQTLLKKYLSSVNLEQSSSMPDLNLKNEKMTGLRTPNLKKLRSKFQRSKSQPILNVVPEEKENPATDSSFNNTDEMVMKKNSSGNNSDNNNVSSGRKKMFTKKKRVNTHQSTVIAQHRKRVAFLLMNETNELENGIDNPSMKLNTENTTSKPNNNHSDNNNGLFLDRERHSKPSGSNSFNIDQSSSSDTLNKRNSVSSKFSSTIKVSKKSHFKGGRFCTLMLKFTTILPRDEIAEKTIVIKDATDVFPVDNGGAIVLDILSNKMVLFDDSGFPKVTFAMETGSEPWSAVVTPDSGSMAATLKGEGCVCLWSPKGEPQTDFGHGILASPTGIRYDHLGRFVVADEEKNAIYLFSRTGNFIKEFVNQDSLNPFAGNKTAETLKQPRYICLSRDGLYFVSDSSNQVVKVFDEAGNILHVIGSYGREDGQFRFPYGVAFDDDTKLLYVADHFNHRVSVFSSNGTFLYHILTQADGIMRPKGLAIRDSKLFVTFGSLRANCVSVYRIHANREE